MADWKEVVEPETKGCQPNVGFGVLVCGSCVDDTGLADKWDGQYHPNYNFSDLEPWLSDDDEPGPGTYDLLRHMVDEQEPTLDTASASPGQFAFREFMGALGKKVAWTRAKQYKQQYKANKGKDAVCHYGCGAQKCKAGQFEMKKSWWWEYVFVQSLRCGKVPPQYPCEFDDKTGLWFRQTKRSLVPDDEIHWELCEGDLDLPCDAEYDEKTHQWMHWVQRHGYVCAKCYGEYDHYEGKGKEKQHKVLTEAEVQIMWTEEAKEYQMQRGQNHKQMIMEAIVLDPAKAEAMLCATKKELVAMTKECALECLALKSFTHVFSGQEGQQLLVQFKEYVVLTNKLLDTDLEAAKTLESLHGCKFWDIFTEKLANQYWDDEETLEALKELREWDDVKVRYPDGRPMMSILWRHAWQVCSEKCEKKTWVSTHGGWGKRAQGNFVVELDAEGNPELEWPDHQYCNRAFPSTAWTPSALHRNTYYCPWRACQGRFRFGSQDRCQVVEFHAIDGDRTTTWTSPCQQPHPLLMKWLHSKNLPFWKALVKLKGTVNIRSHLDQKMDYALSYDEAEAGKMLPVRHDPDAPVLNSDFFVKWAVAGALRQHADHPDVMSLVDDFKGKILTDGSKKSAQAVQELAKILDEKCLVSERLEQEQDASPEGKTLKSRSERQS